MSLLTLQKLGLLEVRRLELTIQRQVREEPLGPKIQLQGVQPLAVKEQLTALGLESAPLQEELSLVLGP